MKLKFNGFKSAPIRNHIVVEIKGRYTAVQIGETIAVEPEDGYKFLSTGEWTEIKDEEKAPKEEPKPRAKAEQSPKTMVAPQGENRAILDGKAE